MSSKLHFHVIEETYYEDGCYTKKMVWRPMHVVDAQQMERAWQLQRQANALAVLKEARLTTEQFRIANGKAPKYRAENEE